jgi:hypothetical protein
MAATRYFGQPSSVLLPGGNVLVVGGITCCPYQWYSTAELYKVATGSWWEPANSSVTPAQEWPIFLYDGQILIEGGVSGVQFRNEAIVSAAKLYDPAKDVWTGTGSMTTRRYDFTATRLGDGHVLVAGGDDGSGSLLASAELYDPVTGQWTATGSMPAPAFGQMATLLPDGQVLVAGGQDPNGNALASAELYTPPSSGTLTVKPASGVVSQAITLNASGFGPGEIVRVYLDTTNSAPVYVAATNDTGILVIHRNVVEQTYGSHTLIAVGQTSQRVATANFFARPSLTVLPGAGSAGQTVGVVGHGYGADEAFTLRWNSAKGPLLQQDNSNSDGTVISFFVVPKAASRGRHLVYGRGETVGSEAIAIFRVS